MFDVIKCKLSLVDQISVRVEKRASRGVGRNRINFFSGVVDDGVETEHVVEVEPERNALILIESHFNLTL
jgi:hypothetical protein